MPLREKRGFFLANIIIRSLVNNGKVRYAATTTDAHASVLFEFSSDTRSRPYVLE